MANLMPRPDVAEWWGIFSKHQLSNQIQFKIFLILSILLEITAIVLNFKITQNIKKI
jgi:hypothetical protein